MKFKGSIIAEEIMRDLYREKKLKETYEANKRRQEKKKEEQNSIK